MPPIDLFERMSDQQVTVFGFTGTLSELATMCPVNLNSPDVTVDAKNTFIVNAANEAGLAIAPEFKQVFDSIAQREGWQQKYTVVEPSPAAAVRPGKESVGDEPQALVRPESRPDATTDAKTQNSPVALPAVERRVAIEPDLALQAALPAPEAAHDVPPSTVITAITAIDPRLEAPAALAEEAIVTASDFNVEPPPTTTRIIAHELTRITIEQVMATHPADTGLAIPEQGTEVAATPRITAVGELAMTRIEPMEAIAYVDLGTVEPAQTNLVQPEGVAFANETIQPAADDEVMLGIGDAADLRVGAGAGLDIMPIVTEVRIGVAGNDESEEANKQTLEDATAAWAEVLYMHPSEVYEDFTAIMLERAMLPRVEIDDGADETLTIQPLADETRVPSADTAEAPSGPPAIVRKLAERLVMAEPLEQEEAAPIMQAIAGAVHGLMVLEARQAGSEQADEVELQLRELCQELFQTLRIEYDEQDVRQFVSLLLRPDFRLSKPITVAEDRAVNLEYDGTHEAKRFLAMDNGLATVRSRIEASLGSVVMVNLGAGAQLAMAGRA